MIIFSDFEDKNGHCRDFIPQNIPLGEIQGEFVPKNR